MNVTDVLSQIFGYEQKSVDFHCRRTLSLYNSTRSTSVQGDHFHSVYFAAGMALRLLIRFAHCGGSRLMGLHYRSSHRKPFTIPAGQGRIRQRYTARRKLFFIRGVAAFRSNEGSVLDDVESFKRQRIPVAVTEKDVLSLYTFRSPSYSWKFGKNF